jgi:DNA-binding transcriptional LysR family regulator
MSLTPEGLVLLTRSKGPLAELDEINRIFDESRGLVSGPLRISAPVGFARHQLVALVAAFSAKHPDIEIEIDASDSVRDFAESPVDVAFRILRPTDSSVIARAISRLQAVTVASPDYLLRKGRPEHPQDLQGHACIAYRYANTGRMSDLRFVIGGQETALAIRPSLIVNDVEVGCEAAVQGLGLAQPPSNYVVTYIADGRLVPLMTQFIAAPWTIYLCYPSRHNQPLRVRKFIEFAVTRLGKDRFVLAPSKEGRRAKR